MEIKNELSKKIELKDVKELLLYNDNILDSAVCLLAAYDFITGDVYPPEILEHAKKEGWIWFKKNT